MTIIKSIHSELIKLKYPPILWLVGFIIGVTLLIVFSAHYIDIHKTVALGRSPWTRLNVAAEAIFSIFIGVPFIVLLISAAVHIEHQNHGFKQLYTFPKNREILILYKLTTLLLSLVLAIMLLIFGNIMIGYLLNTIYPETEFTYYELPIFSMLKSYSYIFISFLGIIGIQFFLSLRFKGFLVPASIGILGYIIGLILSSISNSMSIYFPYSYPIITRHREMFDTSALHIDQSAILNKVELLSIAIFFAFLVLSLYTERNKNI